MVLQKIGETVTDILVNGSQEASYTQSENSQYDIQASPSSFNWNKIGEVNVSGDGTSVNSTTKTFDKNGLNYYKLDHSVDIASTSTYSIYAKAIVNGNTVLQQGGNDVFIDNTKSHAFIQDDSFDIKSELSQTDSGLGSGETSNITVYEATNTEFIDVGVDNVENVVIPSTVDVSFVNKV